MFVSLNLFKSINCPFYSSIANASTCERPYCQFKHGPNHALYTSIQFETSTISSISNNNIKKESESENNHVICGINELPSALENLSNALQTVQDLFRLNSNNSQSGKTTNAITEQLNNLSSTILSSVASSNILKTTTGPTNSNTDANSSSAIRKSSSPSSRKQKSATITINAPVYNPTPILELKKFSQKNNEPYDVPLINQEKTLSGFKRKSELCDNDDDNENYENEFAEIILEQNESNDSVNKFDDVKKKKKVNSEEMTSSSPSNSTTAVIVKNQEAAASSSQKLDMASFAKLKPSQQLLKRYEMLNKPIPSANTSTIPNPKKQISSKDLQKNSSSSPTVPRLIMDTSGTLKVPLVMRQRYLSFIFDNGKTSFATLEKACEKAAEQEKSIYDRSKNKTIYTNLAANLIKSLRDQHVQQIKEQHQHNASNKPIVNSPTKLINNQKTQGISYSHEVLLSGPKASRVSYSINKVKQIEIKDLTENQLYQVFSSYVLNEKQLEENSFPLWMTTVNNINAKTKDRLACIPNFKNASVSKISSANKINELKQNEESDNEANVPEDLDKYIIKKCKRCNKPFQITSKSFLYSPSNSECVFHWGKLRSTRFNKSIEQKYSCCSGDINSGGCETGKHVYDGDYDGNSEGKNISGYIETSENLISRDELKSKSSLNIFALDCEMCYTTKGLELARVSVVDINLKEVYESIVKPDYQILDYNTRWSGLTEESLRDCNKNLKQVQSELLKFLNKDSILIGHSLDSDFKALKLIHKTVIDTSVVFPHKMGPPLKRALRNLMSEYLQKTIQEDADGHDSKEDANSCIQLMLYKISEDLKLKKPPFLNEIQVQVQTQVNTSVQVSKSVNTYHEPPKIASSTLSKSFVNSKPSNSGTVPVKKNNSNSQQHVLSPQAIAKAKMLAKTQSYTNTHFNSKFSSKFS